MSDFNYDQALLLAALAGLAPERHPDPATRERMRAAILDRANASTIHVTRRNGGDWTPLLPGVEVKTLRKDIAAGTQTTLWRVQPGARVPGHPHSREEECLIVEGSIVHDGVEYVAGDFLFAYPGESHKVFESPRGALFLIRGELMPDATVLAKLPR